MAKREQRASFAAVLTDTTFARFWWVLILVSSSLVVLHLARLDRAAIDALPVAYWVVLAFVVLGEMRPVVATKNAASSGVNLATAFHFAVVLTWGVEVALVGVLVGSGIGDLLRRKELYRLLFNLAQYTGSYLVSWYLLVLLGWSASPTAPATLHPRELGLIVLAAIAYHLTNLALVGSAISLAGGRPIREGIFEDFWWHTSTTLGVMALSPLVVVVIASNWGFLPLLVLPLYLVWATANLALEREQRGLRDDLTGLANRAQLTALVTARAQQPTDDPAALCLLDLDRFKEVNDTLGHTTGDHLLQAVAARLAAACREGDTVARLGGDEFALLLEIDEIAEAERALTRITDAIKAPFEVGGMLLEVEVSAGIAVFPDHGSDLETLLRRADLAMYEAKGRGETVIPFAEELDHRTPGRLALLADLRRALVEGELVLAYQPQVDAADGTVVSAEALLRWQHPQRGLLLPGAFLPQAEQTAVMREVTSYVLEQVMRQLGRWQRAGIALPVAANATLHDLADRGFADRVADGLGRHGLAPELLCLEITEQALVSDPTRVLSTLTRLHAMGVRLSLDDFGTGHASLTRLKRLPVDEVKIDRSFVVDLDAGGAADRAIVRSVVDLAHACGLRTVAEGVETDAQFTTLRSLRCDVIQGWLFATAMPPDTFEVWLQDRHDHGVHQLAER